MLKKRFLALAMAMMMVSSLAMPVHAAEGFDADWYADHNPDVAAVCGGNEEALYNHYVSYGIYEGRSGSADFNVAAYMVANPDLVAAFGDDPVAFLNHYETIGHTENRITTGNVSLSNGGVTRSENACSFDAAYYALHKPDVLAVFGNDYDALYAHYLTFGITEGRNGSADFNLYAYMDGNPDLVALYGDNYEAYLAHFDTVGKTEDRPATFEQVTIARTTAAPAPAPSPAPTPATNQNVSSGSQNSQSSSGGSSSGGSNSGGSVSTPPYGTLEYCYQVMQGHREWEIISDTRTCTEPGVITEACVICGFSYSTSYGAAGHDFVEVGRTENVTCDTSGIIRYECAREGCDFTVGVDLYCDGTRQYSNDTSTCQAGGTANWTCTCGASGTEEVPAHFGTSVLVRNEPETCTTNETNYYHCTSCGADWSAEEGEEMLGHVLNMINYSITPATCTEDGWEYNACTREGCDYEETNEIPALGHNMVFVETVEATCTEDGYDLYRCDREGCGEEEHRNVTEAEDCQATEEEPGVCQWCGQPIESGDNTEGDSVEESNEG